MSDDDTYEIPLQNQRVFGAGIKRQRVKFVPSATTSVTPSSSRSSGQSVSDLYLKLVLPNEQKTAPFPLKSPNCQLSLGGDLKDRKCAVCSLPLSEMDVPPSQVQEAESNSKQRSHEASLAHQVCMAHSYPPSHLDRNRKGLTYLSAYGWDPDARLGLGAEGQGIQFPIKTRPKYDHMGIGLELPKKADMRKKEKIQKLDAGKVRKMYEQDKKKAERLREIFYRNDDVERYLAGSD